VTFSKVFIVICRHTEKKSLIVATRLWLDSAKFEVNSVNDVIS